MSTLKKPFMFRQLAQLGILGALLMGWLCPSAHGTLVGLSKLELHDVMTLGRAISELQPKLNDEKAVQYALGIYKAAKHYRIDPRLLIAIAHQETSFRENLPEGAAGEIGLCQIRKVWLQNKEFIKEFGNRGIKDLRSPEHQFLFAAWILRDLKESNPHIETVPWWTYYNARKLKNRVRYYMHVNRKLERIAKYGPAKTAQRMMASTKDDSPADKIAVVTPPIQRRSTRKQAKRRARTPSKNDFVYTASAGAPNKWISSAVDSLSKQGAEASKGKWSGHHSRKSRRNTSPSLRRTVSDLRSVN